MATKRYILKRIYDLTTTVVVDGVQVVVRFTGGSRYSGTRGFYITKDERIQKALEESNSFGKIYDEDKTYVIASAPKVDAPKEKVPTAEDMLQNPETAIRDTTVTSKAKAIAYVQGKFDATFVSNDIAKMKIEAAQRWNIIFTAWH